MKKVKVKVTTVAVRFSGKAQIYTYKIRQGVKLVPGDLCVADSPYNGPTIVFVVRVDKTPKIPDGYTLESLKWLEQKVVNL